MGKKQEEKREVTYWSGYKENEKLKLIKLKIRFIAILLDIIYLVEDLKFLLNHVMFLILIKICDVYPFTKY